MVHLGVTGEMAVYIAEGAQLLLREITPRGQRGIERRCAVTLAEDEPVSVGAVRLLRVYIHFIKIQSGQKLADRERTAEMAGCRAVNHFKCTAANTGRNQHQFSGFFVGNDVFHKHESSKHVYMWLTSKYIIHSIPQKAKLSFTKRTILLIFNKRLLRFLSKPTKNQLGERERQKLFGEKQNKINNKTRVNH